MRGATDFGPRGGRATAQRLLADADTTRPRAECDNNHVRCRGAKSFVDDLVLSRGVVLSRADLFCDLLRLSPLTRRFVRLRRTYRPARERGRGASRACQRSVERSSVRPSSGGPNRRPFGGFFFAIFFRVLRCPSGLCDFSVAFCSRAEMPVYC